MKITIFLQFLLFYFNKSVYCETNKTLSSFENWNLKSNSIDTKFENVVMCDECIDIFIDYMILKNINQVVIYSCGLRKDLINFNKHLIKAGISSTFLTDKSLEISKINRLFPEREIKGVFVNGDCQRSKHFIDLASRLSLFDDVRLWAVFTKDPAATVSDMRAANLNIDTNLIIIVKGRDQQWIAYDIFNIGHKKGAPLNITFFGTYNSKQNGLMTEHNYPKPVLLRSTQNYTINEINMLLTDLQKAAQSMGHVGDAKWGIYLDGNWIRRRWDMKREITLTGAYCTVDKPRIGTQEGYIHSKENVHRDTFTRMYFAMLDHMMDMMQFKIKLIHTKTWGAYVDGAWTGVLGALTQGHADMSLSPMALKKERVGAGDVNAYACMARFPVIFRQPQTSTASLALFVYPLEAKCWFVALPISVLAVLITMLIMTKESKFVGTNAENSDITLSNFIISLVCVLYQDGPEKSPRLWSGRALLFVMLMFGYMMTQFYSASLIGSILMEPPKQISNVRDLVKSPLHFRAEAVSYQWMFFKEYMSFEEVNELYNEKLMKPGKWPPYMNVDEGLLMAKKGGFAFQTNAAYAYKEMRDWGDDIICEVDEILVYPLTRLYSRVSRGSPYRQHITTSMLLQYERGVQSYLIERWFIKRPRCPPEHASRPRPVADQFYPALELLATICGISIVILIMEVIAARAAHKRKLYPYIH